MKKEENMTDNGEGSRTKKHPCRGCRYLRGRFIGYETCDYIFIEGHRRPCPPGEDCTVQKKL